ncbi:MAG: hypothetical protein GYB36_03990 [Alphaproteobacteria bacterium]|nr:hypothetical protein [Alphaproteobacteria bacterium]
MIAGLDIDHIMIACDDPRTDFETFKELTGYPEAWPYNDFGAIKTGAIWVGQTAIEFAKLEGAKSYPPRIAGLALSSSLEPWDLADALKGLGISHVPPTHIAPDSEDRLSWVNLMIGGFLTGEPRTLWLGRRFGGGSGFARWMSRMAENMAAKPGGLQRLNGVLDKQMAFFIRYLPEQTAIDQRAAAQLSLSSTISARIEIGLGASALQAGNWSSLIGSDITPGCEWESPSGTVLSFLTTDRAELQRIVLTVTSPPRAPLPLHLGDLIEFREA